MATMKRPRLAAVKALSKPPENATATLSPVITEILWTGSDVSSSDEWIGVANWLYNNWDIIGGLSFLPRFDHVYQLAPYEEISEEKTTFRVLLTSAVGQVLKNGLGLLGIQAPEKM